ncbi:isopentenyl-diphosphate Delta-isomerase 1-like [Diadema setosum]|uniref:isopentenyl-diphosphate Delta-isomerase 1-like n=1 Tax=Diadema setosum TaxID=31175 RepID=UPI003B3BA751
MLSASVIKTALSLRFSPLLREFLVCRQFSARGIMTTNGLDDTQVKLLAEQCIVVDKDDNVIGAASKKECHLYQNIKNGLLHRAFSVFLFNQKGELLLQQRSDAKITFPGYWANTCCSHPLHFDEEMELKDALGVKRAARRKLKHELGIEPEQVPVEDFTYLTRVHYQAPSDDGVWGEHEIDHVLVVQREVDLKPEPNEVQAVRYVTPTQLEELLAEGDCGKAKVSPWFAKIARNLLIPKWWSGLADIKKFQDPETIHRL